MSEHSSSSVPSGIMTDKGFKKRGGVGVDILSFKFKRKTNPPSNLQEEISDLRELKTLNQETKTEIHEKLRICENKIVRNTKLNQS